MTDDIETRLRAVETGQAVGAAMLARMEQDLKEIAVSSNAIREVVTKWKGGIAVVLLLGGALAAAISIIVEVVTRKFFP